MLDGNMKKQTGLQQYIARVGNRQFSKKFKVSIRAAESWRWGARVPKTTTAVRIVRLSRGALSLSDLYPGG